MYLFESILFNNALTQAADDCINYSDDITLTTVYFLCTHASISKNKLYNNSTKHCDAVSL